jgi:hypothetical protein
MHWHDVPQFYRLVAAPGLNGSTYGADGGGATGGPTARTDPQRARTANVGIDTWVTTGAALALARLARHHGVRHRETLERRGILELLRNTILTRQR